MSRYGQWGKRSIEEFLKDMKALYSLRHPNVLSIVGCTWAEGPLVLIECMQQGTLYALLHNPTVQFDGEGILNLLRGIANGLDYLHQSNIIHGNLRSDNILMDFNMSPKIAGFSIRPGQQASFTLWTAPEVLRGSPPNPASDVYSFGMIFYEVLTRHELYEGMDPDKILQLVADARQDDEWLRPTLPPTTLQVSADAVPLMRECWHATAVQRPLVPDIRKRLTQLTAATVDNILPAFQVSDLSSNRSYRTGVPGHLSRQRVPSKLSALASGSSGSVSTPRVPRPQNLQCLTCVFTDVVGFSTICTDLTSEQTVDFLNRLYFRFDELARRHKVECVDIIGDAYLAVSGLHNETPEQQVSAICRWALEAVFAANQVKICATRPDLGCVQIRAGVHMGPCTAAIVGRQQKQFTLFGDTVNCASRMESTSLPDRVQVSEHVARTLMACEDWPSVEGSLVRRGPVTLKGIGRMVTYWLKDPKRPQFLTVSDL